MWRVIRHREKRYLWTTESSFPVSTPLIGLLVFVARRWIQFNPVQAGLASHNIIGRVSVLLHIANVDSSPCWLFGFRGWQAMHSIDTWRPIPSNKVIRSGLRMRTFLIIASLGYLALTYIRLEFCIITVVLQGKTLKIGNQVIQHSLDRFFPPSLLPFAVHLSESFLLPSYFWI